MKRDKDIVRQHKIENNKQKHKHRKESSYKGNKKEEKSYNYEPYQLNPFEFVPVSSYGPKEVDDSIHKEERLEGEISYSIKVLTPLHISGKIDSVDNKLHGRKKRHTINFRHFNRKYNNKNFAILPGSSIRGMLSAFIETLTNSDLKVLTKSYPKKPGKRFVGIEMQYGENIVPKNDNDNGIKKRFVLPNGYNTHKINDIATFLFGHVSDDEKNKEGAFKGRLRFDDIVVKKDQLTQKDGHLKALDLKESDSSFGAPNIRANTAWYFNPSDELYRRNSYPKDYHALAESIRGRKFYFHQKPEKCIAHYSGDKKAWKNLTEYDVECVKRTKTDDTKLSGKIAFSEMPKSMLQLLLFCLSPGENFAHKLGGLKPLGFGSIQITVDFVKYRNERNIFSGEEALQMPKIEYDAIQKFTDATAWEWLRVIHQVPGNWDSDDHLFVYPKYVQSKDLNPYLKGFANPQAKSTSVKEHAGKIDPNNSSEKLTNNDKLTLYFDVYQKYASNFNVILGEIENYSHKPY